MVDKVFSYRSLRNNVYRDHQRPAFHAALGVDPDWYAHEVFTKTSKLSKQIFPITLDIDHPRWKKGLLSIQKANQDLADAKAKGRKLAQLTSSIRAGLAFVMLFTVPSKKHSVPSVHGWSLLTDVKSYCYSMPCGSI